jgi:hypothetical protein
VFLNLQQTSTTYEPACNWYWIAPDGSQVIPDYPIQWCCNEPDNNGNSGIGANQGIFINYSGSGAWGILDDDQTLKPTGSFCQCGKRVNVLYTRNTPETNQNHDT